jgi:D-glycero-D-manno-heptose 1,7-bisphosphate phosphatase
MPHQLGGHPSLKASPRRFVVLDRDGTINVERHYLTDPAQLELLPGAAEGLRQMQAMGLGLIVITNQSGIGRGLLSWQQLGLIQQRLNELLAAEGVCLNGVYVCPHRPEEHCRCRKPATGLLEVAASELDFDPPTCFVIGDKSSDIDLGRRVGATTLLVRTGYGAQLASQTTGAADYIVEDVRHAAEVIKNPASAYKHLSCRSRCRPFDPAESPANTLEICHTSPGGCVEWRR